MDDKNKVGLIYAVCGIALGIASGVITKLGIPRQVVYLLFLLGVYLTSYLVPFFGIDVEKFGGVRKILTSGFFSALMTWVVFWIILYNLE
ncbi:MAG: hypothetical protein ACE5K0_06575 [Candidatus Methanofastidiosia archaeon]